MNTKISQLLVSLYTHSTHMHLQNYSNKRISYKPRVIRRSIRRVSSLESFAINRAVLVGLDSGRPRTRPCNRR